MKSNKVLVFLIIVYIIAMFSVISWGLPSETRPFTYNMDEWHQLAAVRALFEYGTPNVAGAAHGSIFQFFLSGIYLIPFAILGFVNPFAIQSSIDNPVMQERIFIIMRSNTLLFGVLSLITLAVITKKYFNTSSVLTVVLFLVTPIWLTLSTYFKYDIALVFWIILSILSLLHYAKYPALRNFILSAIPCALSFATKVSAAPILLIYIFSFFWFTPQFKKKYRHLVIGILVFSALFIAMGIPDLFFRWGDYVEYLSSNIITGPKQDNNYLLGRSNKWIYILTVLFPTIFGHAFYFLFFIAFIYWFFQIVKWVYLKKFFDHKNEIFLLFSLVMFLLSLIPLGLGSTGNRLLVLLPFLSLLSTKFIINILKLSKYKVLLVVLIIIAVVLQLRESSVVIYTKYSRSALRKSSEWIIKNVPKGTVIGIENIPIYQTLPDIVLREYYLLQSNKYAKTNYLYNVINASSRKLPKFIVITNRYVDEKYLIKSPKKDLLKRLNKEGYRVVKEFMPDSDLYKLFYNDLNYYTSGLNFVLPVTIYGKN